MGPDLEIKNKSNGATEVFVCKENVSMPGDSENKVVQCVNNSKDNNFDWENLDVDRGKVMDRDEDVEVNIIDCTKSSGVGEIEVQCDDETESMSSFGDTDSESKNGSVLTDAEVESPLFVNEGPVSIFDSYGGAFQMRRKKLTDHWRRFIRPLMWRCKWVELQIKEIQSQACKYDREIAEHEQRKQFNFETHMAEGFPVKSVPFSTCIGRKKVMKRKKRKRFEDTTDASSYMLQHNLFSFYENKRSATDGAFIDDDCSNLDKTNTGNDELGFQDGLASLESRDNISEHTLRKIELLQLQVHKLKARIEKVVSENPGKFSSVNALSILAPVDALTSSDINHDAIPKNGGRIPVRSPRTLPRRMSESNMGDLMPGKAISNQGEATSHSDMIESIGQPQVGISGKNAREGILIHNDAVKLEIGILNNFDSGPAKKPQVLMEKQIVQASESELPEDMLVARVRYGGKSLPKSWSNLSDNKSNVCNNKRKRGKRR